MEIEQLPEHVAGNREAWDVMAAEYVTSGERNWAGDEPTWGIFSVPETQLRCARYCTRGGATRRRWSPTSLQIAPLTSTPALLDALA